MGQPVNLKKGQYYYARHRDVWGVWRAGDEKGGARIDDFVCDFQTMDGARDFVYNKNNRKRK